MCEDTGKPEDAVVLFVNMTQKFEFQEEELTLIALALVLKNSNLTLSRGYFIRDIEQNIVTYLYLLSLMIRSPFQ